MSRRAVFPDGKSVSIRSLNRNLKNISRRIIKDDEQGKDPKPEDLSALKVTVDLLIKLLKAKP